MMSPFFAAFIFVEKSADGVSLEAYIVILVNALIWIVYGSLVDKNKIVVLSAAVSMILGAVVFIAILIYK